jgi:hypothetical protein
MKIDAPGYLSVRHVAENMREGDAREFLAVSPAKDRAELVDRLVARYGEAPDAFGFYDEDRNPIAIGAMVQHRPNVVTLAFFATDDFPRIAADLAKFARRSLFPAYQKRGVHRIECISIEGYEAAHRWIEMLGLKREAVMPGYGRDGETYIQFAWVADARPVGA